MLRTFEEMPLGYYKAEVFPPVLSLFKQLPKKLNGTEKEYKHIT